MSDGSTIEWLNCPGYKPASWNPTKGCTRVSEGCRNCYAEVMAARFSQPGQWGHGIAEMRGGDHRWTGVVELDDDKLLLPLRWRKPRCVFVNSTSDLFHEKLPYAALDRVFAVMTLCPHHLFIVLTKRSEQLCGYHSMARAHPVGLEAIGLTMEEVGRDPRSSVGNGIILQGDIAHLKVWPLPNVILGVSVEDQLTANERIPHLLATPAACRMVSYEPALGPVDLRRIRHHDPKKFSWLAYAPSLDALTGNYPLLEDGRKPHPNRIGWVVTGGESGPGARPAHPDWFRSVRDQCQAAGVPFFFKQWGEWAPATLAWQPHPFGIFPDGRHYRGGLLMGPINKEAVDIAKLHSGQEYVRIHRVGKKHAGRLLDGREHTEFPTLPSMDRFDRPRNGVTSHDHR